MCAHNDFYTSGDCRTCGRERHDKYARRRKLAMQLLRVAEARGMSGYEALAVLRNVSYLESQRCQAEGFPASGPLR